MKRITNADVDNVMRRYKRALDRLRIRRTGYTLAYGRIVGMAYQVMWKNDITGTLASAPGDIIAGTKREFYNDILMVTKGMEDALWFSPLLDGAGAEV